MYKELLLEWEEEKGHLSLPEGFYMIEDTVEPYTGYSLLVKLSFYGPETIEDKEKEVKEAISKIGVKVLEISTASGLFGSKKLVVVGIFRKS